jgi:hypothetical protein
MKKSLLALALLSAVGTTQAETVTDLSDWQVDGDGDWTYNVDDNSWYQSINTPEATFLYDPSGEALGKAISGTISVQTTNDDDMIGFVVGYSAGEQVSEDANYLLMTWKQSPQSGWDAGMTLWHITGSLAYDDLTANDENFWYPDDVSVATLVDTSTNYGSTGWADNVAYDFDVAYNGSYLAVFVNGELEMSIAPGDAGMEQFEEGSFGFYNFSQDNVLYDGVEYDDVAVLLGEEQIESIAQAVPIQGASVAALLALGLAGYRRKK